MNARVSIDDLRINFEYDPESGIMRSLTSRRNHCIGDKVGSPDKQGYLITHLNKVPMKVHRMAWAMQHGSWPDGHIDHINGVKDDNRILNLRVVTNAENKQNVTLSKRNKSGFLGVTLHKDTGLWRADIGINGKQVSLGRFKTPEEASEAYLNAKKRLHPFNEVYK